MGRHDTPAAVGGSSLLVIFAALCLVVFALLSISTVQADGRLSEAAAGAAAAYYEADSRAEEILALLRAGTIPDGVEQDGANYRYQCPISETQTLQVTVALTGSSYEILQWQVISAADWDSSASPVVWDGTTGT